MEGPQIAFTIPIFGGIAITETVINAWIVIGIVFFLCLFLTHGMEKIPQRKTQLVAEKLVLSLDHLVESTMGRKNAGYAPYILTLMCGSVFGSLISLVGLRSVTADINTTATWAVMTFLLVQANGIRSKGVVGYFKGFGKPVAFLAPINVISEFSTPLSMAVRHFANILVGMIIMNLLYTFLGWLSAIALPFDLPLLQAGIPAMFSLYFDLFSGLMQAFIFAMLTMVFVSNAQD